MGIRNQLMSPEDVAGGLCRGQFPARHQQRLGVGFLTVHHREDHGRDLALDVVRLVDHIRHVPRGGARCRELVVDQEEFERVHAARHQVVIGILAVVEVEAAQPAGVEQERDDLLDVHARRVVSQVHEDLRLGAQREAQRVGRAPVRDVRAVEGRLEEFIFHEHAGVVRQVRVNLLQPLFHAAPAAAQIVLAGVVRAVGKPQAQRLALHFAHHVAAFDDLLDGPRPDGARGVAQRAQAVRILLEDVRIHRADGEAAGLCMGPECGPVVVRGAVPRDVNRHGRGDPREPLHHGRVVDLLENRARRAGPGKNMKPRARVRVAPGGRFNPLLVQRGLDRRHGNAPLLHLFRQDPVCCVRHKFLRPAAARRMVIIPIASDYFRILLP